MKIMTSQRSKTGKLTATIALAAAVAVTVAILPTSAEAWPLRFLFGGGNGNNAHVMEDRVSRTPVPFVSQYEPGTIIVSFSDRRLYYVTGRGQALAYLIGTPAGDAKWSGTSYVSDKQVNPRWVPTPDMRAEDPTLPLEVAGGHPRNPLGVRALYLGDTLYRIHGTDAPWTVGQEVSHGCIRLFISDIIDI